MATLYVRFTDGSDADKAKAVGDVHAAGKRLHSRRCETRQSQHDGVR